MTTLISRLNSEVQARYAIAQDDSCCSELRTGLDNLYSPGTLPVQRRQDIECTLTDKLQPKALESGLVTSRFWFLRAARGERSCWRFGYLAMLERWVFRA